MIPLPRMRTAVGLAVALLQSIAALAQSEDPVTNSFPNHRRAVGNHPPVVTHAPVTTFDLIDDAIAHGRLSAEEGTIYKVYSLFDDPRLPAAYRGNDSGLPDSDFMTEVDANFQAFSSATQDALRPFLIPPFYENSWWSLRHGSSAGRIGTNAQPCPNCPLSLFWDFVETANGKVKIWYVKSLFGSDEKGKAQAFANEIDYMIWPALTRLMAGHQPLPDDGDAPLLGYRLGGDGRLDIALVDVPRSTTTARYPDKCDGAAWAFIQFNRNKGKEELAHELMHAFQYSYKVKVRDANCTGESEYRWLMESTAEWVKDYVYPASTSEHWAAPKMLDEPELPLDLRSDPHWYGAYLLPFFLARIEGQTEIVGKIWANTENAGSIEAVEQALQALPASGGFEKVWPNFVLYNWNQNPVDEYNKVDALDAHPAEHGDTFLVPGTVDTYAPLNVELPHLSATYKHFVFNGGVRSIAFLNGLTFRLAEERHADAPLDFGLQYAWSDLPADAKRGASVQAIIKKNGTWQKPEVWTDQPYKAFCLDRSDEKIEEIVLIFANSNTDPGGDIKPASLPPIVIATNYGCRWQGKLSYDWDFFFNGSRFNVTYDLRREPNDPLSVSRLFLGYSYNASGRASWVVDGAASGCTAQGHSDNAVMRTDLPHYSFNFAPKDSTTYRKAFFPAGLEQFGFPYTLSCPGAPPAQQILAALGGKFPPAEWTYVDVQPDGHVKGELDQAPLGMWKWDFTAP